MNEKSIKEIEINSIPKSSYHQILTVLISCILSFYVLPLQ